MSDLVEKVAASERMERLIANTRAEIAACFTPRKIKARLAIEKLGEAGR